MALSGPEALRSLDEALRDIRREEDEIARRLARSADLISKMREQEGELLRSLAEIRLDPATQAELAGEISAAERKARDMLKTHAAALSASESRLAAVDAEIAKSTAERAKLQSEAAARDAELKALAEKVRPALLKDETFIRKRDEAAAMTAVAGESMRKTAQAETDREQKGRPYRDDPLFMYLWSNGYGTKTYRANNVVAWLDRMVARLVGFAEARPNFAMLNEIPLRLREHAERQEHLAAAAQEAVVALETTAIDAAGGTAARQAMEAVVARIDELDKAMVSLQDERDEMLKAQRDLAQGSDPDFTEAIAGLAEALGRESLQNLLAEARATRTGQDDTIVQQIDEARQRAKEEDSDATEQKTRLKALAARRRELEDIQYEFKKQGFDNPRSTFREDKLVGDLLNDFLRGAISATSYWDQWRRSQNWDAPRGDDWNFGERFGGPDGDQRNPWGGPSWPDSSFAGPRRTPGFGGPGGGWGRIGWGSSGSAGSLSRPRSGISIGNRSSGGGFRTGGAASSGGFKTGGGI